MSRFNPEQFQPLKADLTPVPNHGVSWKKKYANWWGGATIASPTMGVVGPAKLAVEAVRRFMPEGVERLTRHYLMDMDYSRFLVKQLLELSDTTPVIFEASGTSAILLASRIFAYLSRAQGASRYFAVTTDEGGSLVPAALRGRNPNQMEKAMFQPAAALFYEPEPVLPYPQGMEVDFQLITLSRFSNSALVEELVRLAEELSGDGTVPGAIVLPHVTKTGRILPIRQVAAALERLRARGIDVRLIVDDIQGISRCDAESTADPVSFADAYIFGSSKALGGLLIASSIVMKEELLERFTSLCAGGQVEVDHPFISHFQLEPRFEERLPERLFKPGAISLPEVVAMREAVRLLFLRGEGESYSERRQYQLEEVARLRAQVVAALSQVEGLEILESTAEEPLVPSIVCFKPPRPFSAAAFKKALQEGSPIVTASACIGRYVRLDIPEYRPMPSIDVLVEKIKSVIARS